jgi:hypothetical protein
VPELGVQQAVQDAAIGEDPAADPGADREVAERVQSGRRAPPPLATSVSAQPGLGVVVIVPQVGEERRMSTGPNAPTPRTSTGPFAAKNRTARATVSAGDVVGKVSVVSGSAGRSATPQTHLVPPASMPPYLIRRPPLPVLIRQRGILSAALTDRIPH